MSGDRSRDDAGRYTEEVTDQEILKVFDAADAPFLTTADIASELPISSDAVYHRLSRLYEEGTVDKKEVGARAVGWWATVAPELSPAARRRVEESKERDEYVALEDV